MDSNSALSILSIIVECYATILSVVSGFYVFILQRGKLKKEIQIGTFAVIVERIRYRTFFYFLLWCLGLIGWALLSMLFIALPIPSLNITNITNITISAVVSSVIGLIIVGWMIIHMVRIATE